MLNQAAPLLTNYGFTAEKVTENTQLNSSNDQKIASLEQTVKKLRI